MGPRSFRDPDGYCLTVIGRVLRVVYPHAAARVRGLLASDHFKRWVEAKQIPPTWQLDAPAAEEALAGTGAHTAIAEGALVLEQEKVPFVSYPHEWSPEMLFAAGELTLDLHLDALKAGLMLKDATPSNVLFWGARPVFVDVLSFVERPAGSAIWPAYAQFVRTFVLPLLVNRYQGGGTHDFFLAKRDGLEPEEVYARLSWTQRLMPTAFKNVSLPSWLGKSRAAETAEPKPAAQMADERAALVAPILACGLRRSLRAVRPFARRTKWTDYTATSTYDAEALHAKQQFVRQELQRWMPKTVLDVGCNTGHFSRLAARCGASVVAIDYDYSVVDAAYSDAAQNGWRVLPLVANIARPSPALGWDNTEVQSFISRVCGRFDAALLLAVIHHLTVTDGVLLDQVFAQLALVVHKGAIVEFIPPDDPQFLRISRNKAHLAERLDEPNFYAALSKYFRVSTTQAVPGSGRILFSIDRLPV